MQSIRRLSAMNIVVFSSIIIVLFIGLCAELQSQMSQSKQFIALIGDIGGTNIRLSMISFSNGENQSQYKVLYSQKLLVKDFSLFQHALTFFLNAQERSHHYPSIAVIAVAGPTQLNTVHMPNVPKWGLIKASQLAQIFSISQFYLINDFEANAYGLFAVSPSNFIHINHKQIDKKFNIFGVFGPGTGLGHSIILTKKDNFEISQILTSEGGHVDTPFIDEEVLEYSYYLKKRIGEEHIDLQKLFCGPSIPFMLEFYAKKANFTLSEEHQSPETIIDRWMADDSDIIYRQTFDLFWKIYTTALANFMIGHMCKGGVYLVGSLTNSFVHKIENTDILKNWKSRHQSLAQVIDQIPIVFSKQIDLGLKGAFVMAKGKALSKF